MRKAGLTPRTKLVQAEAGFLPPMWPDCSSWETTSRRSSASATCSPTGAPPSWPCPTYRVGRRKRRPGLPGHRATGIHARLAERGHRVERFVEEVESRRPDEEEAQFLRISRAQHVLEVTRLAFDRKGRVLEVTVNVFPSNLWRLSYEWAADD